MSGYYYTRVLGVQLCSVLVPVPIHMQNRVLREGEGGGGAEGRGRAKGGGGGEARIMPFQLQ